jgi:CubicO group peptidase (beta-lactamase class C family)
MNPEQRDGAPSIAVAVARDGRIVWQDAIGYADREDHIRSTPDTPYPVASVTKSSTAAALLLLAKRHQINLNEPVNDYLGPAKLTSPWSDPRTATLRDVMQHRAGLTTFYESCTLEYCDDAPGVASM